MKIPDLSEKDQKRFDELIIEGTKLIYKYFPEIVMHYTQKELMDRLSMTLYLELIHAGLFEDESRCASLLA